MVAGDGIARPGRLGVCSDREREARCATSSRMLRASRPRWSVLAACRVKGTGDSVELIRREGRFDPPEDGSLLVANVVAEQLAELVENVGLGVRLAV